MRERLKACWEAMKLVWVMYDRQHRHHSEEAIVGHIHIRVDWLDQPPTDTAHKVVERLRIRDHEERNTIAIPFDLIMEDQDDGHQDNEGNRHEPA